MRIGKTGEAELGVVFNVGLDKLELGGLDGLDDMVEGLDGVELDW